MRLLHHLVSLFAILVALLFVWPLSAKASGPTANYQPDVNINPEDKDYSGQILFDKRFTKLDLSEANFRGANLTGTVFNVIDLTDANLQDVNFTNGMTYRTIFNGADLTNAIFAGAFLMQSSARDAIVDNVDFSYAIVDFPLKVELCQYAQGENPVTGVDTRASLGC